MPQNMNSCVGAGPTEWNSPQWVCVSVETTLWVCHLWGLSSGALLYSDARLWCVGSWAPGEELLCRLRLVTACDQLGLPGRKYKVI